MQHRILLDTNAYSHFFNGMELMGNLVKEADEIYLPTTVIGELWFGFLKGNKPEVNEYQLKGFLQMPGVFVFKPGMKTAKIYGELSVYLRKQGTPIPLNDIWIAASAVQLGANLVTLDQHFSRLPQVRVFPGQ